MPSSVRIHITGIVQGVGFRPFVYGLATRYSLGGWVRNTSAGVDMEVDGNEAAVTGFIQALQTELPPLARVDEFQVQPIPPNGYRSFQILTSEPVPGAFQPISPDVCICDDCLRELRDPQDRRYRYPFINCTNCGPRFTIITDIPYDRPNTTMAGFPLCPECWAEYENPLDRRFHAQPVACPVCGPQVWLERDGNRLPVEDPIQSAQELLRAGKILAVKGLGGFHLACDAHNSIAVDELRRRKLRVEKPFALMAPDLGSIEQHCYVSPEAAALLLSPARPIVILPRRAATQLAPVLAPGQDTLGFMLPYTPLHYLLLDSFGLGDALVMTSGNQSEEPIAIDNDEARQRLSGLADAFLMHDRPIRTRCDDSVMRVLEFAPPATPNSPLATSHSPFAARISPLRRSRGYTPFPVRLPWETTPILAAGAELKNTFCLARGSYAFLSHHVGDLENWETLRSFEDGIAHFERLFRIQPAALAYDLHPNYLATRYALERAEREGLPATGVQHHHAHIASCLAEHGLVDDRPVIGVAFDGTGYGLDGAIWGGEFLVASYDSFERAAHLAYLPLPGGDAAVRRPARIALAALWQAGLDWDPVLEPFQDLCVEERSALRAQLEHGINTPRTSSMGRLFDGVAALAGVRQRINYEAQAAMELEMLVDPHETRAYQFDFRAGSPLIIDPTPLYQEVVEDVLSAQPVATIAARFHNGIAKLVLELCRRLRREQGLDTVALSGGVWQNLTLLKKALPLLEQDRFTVWIHQQVPANDGGLALGQLAVVSHRLKVGKLEGKRLRRKHVPGNSR